MNDFHTNYAISMNQTPAISLKVMRLMALIAIVAMFAFMPEFAHAGLGKAQSGAQSFLNDIQPIIRIVCIIGVIFCGLAYMNEWVDNRKLFKICAGLVIIASATELVNLLW